MLDLDQNGSIRELYEVYDRQNALLSDTSSLISLTVEDSSSQYEAKQPLYRVLSGGMWLAVILMAAGSFLLTGLLSGSIVDPLTKEPHCPWDLMPQYFTADPQLYDREEWVHAALYRDTPELAARWEEVKAGLDGILKGYGYTRTGLYYQFEEPDGSVLPAEVGDLHNMLERARCVRCQFPQQRAVGIAQLEQ